MARRCALVARRTLLVGACTLAIGCLEGDDNDTGDSSGTGGDDADADSRSSNEDGDEGDVDATGEVSRSGDLELTSPAFDHGDRIPEKYGYEADDVNPPLEIDGVPDGAESLALIADDPDAVEPAGEVWDHWIVWNVPPETTAIPEDWSPEAAEVGTNDFGERGYGGPNPPDAEHRYRFKLFALDATLDLPPETGADELAAAMDGHVLAATQLEGTYPA